MHGLKLSNMVKNKVGSVEILPRRGTWNNKGDVSRSTANHTARNSDPAKGAHTAKENVLDTDRNNDPAIHVDTACTIDPTINVDTDTNVDTTRIIETAMKVDRLDTTRIIDMAKNDPSTVDRENGGSFDSSKVEKTSDATTTGIHASNTVNSYADMAKKFGVDSDSLGTKVNFRNHRARIDVITDGNGILHEGKAVPKAFVDHYVGFLGKEVISIIPINQELFDVRIDQDMAIDMIREGKLPVRYLGVPLVASRVKTSDCRVLIEKVDNHIGDWKNKLLSFAGKFAFVDVLYTFMGHVPCLN
ncbi:hypothetical protein QVD17_41549 [Tagetes erecta]|uniref:Reverse transcriptase n=1 Tax=Tagetes erecta TaxID=13708 RepID=A0AAD8JMW9_TARER|nr:hypothetical protein QVD17_41549 [Tagetes erecta]